MGVRRMPDQENYRQIDVPDTRRRGGASAGKRASSGRRGQSSWQQDSRAQGRSGRGQAPTRQTGGRMAGAARAQGGSWGRGYASGRPGRMLTPSNLLLALIGFLFLFSASVVLVLNLRAIYYADIRLQKLESTTGISEEVIRENYDALIDYNLITKGVKRLEFPSFPMSQHGETHFREVKRIFVAIQCLFAVTGAAFVLGLLCKLRRRDYGSLKLTAILTILVPIVLGVLAVTGWERFFVGFHELFFRNDYWIFDPVTDPVIRILPDVFFFHCAAAILVFLLLGGVLCGVLYRFATRKYRRSGYR